MGINQLKCTQYHPLHRLTPPQPSLNLPKPKKIISKFLDRLFWISDNKPPRGDKTLNAIYFCIDEDIKYIPFFSDFGPLNLASTYRYVTELDKILKGSKYNATRVYHYTSMDSAKRSNAAYLMGAYQVIYLKRTADEAWSHFKPAEPFRAFRDASYLKCNYKCTVSDQFLVVWGEWGRDSVKF